MEYLKNNPDVSKALVNMLASQSILYTSSVLFAIFDWWLTSIICLLLSAPIFVYYSFLSDKLITKLYALQYYIITMLFLLNEFAFIYVKNGIINNEVVSNNKAEALYFSVVTWTTLGYGDFHPSLESRNWAAFEAVIGYVFMGILVAMMLNLAVRRNAIKNA